jgi:hypothetical protein
MHKPSSPSTPFIHGDEVIGELYRKNMVLIPFTIDSWARFGPMLQSFLTTTHHPHQKPWHTSHINNKNHQPNANLMYERTSQPPCPLGILTSADIRWTQSTSPTHRSFFGNFTFFSMSRGLFCYFGQYWQHISFAVLVLSQLSRVCTGTGIRLMPIPILVQACQCQYGHILGARSSIVFLLLTMPVLVEAFLQ